MYDDLRSTYKDVLLRTLDPLLGVFTGALAYYLHEANPRSAPAPGESLSELTRWKLAKWRREREEKLLGDQTEAQ